MTRLAMLAAATALALPMATLPAVTAQAAPAHVIADKGGRLTLQLTDVGFGLRFNDGAAYNDGRYRYNDGYRDDDRYRSYRQAVRRAIREERVERRLEGRFVGQRSREIRHNLRDLGFRRIDIDRRGRGYDVYARRNGRDFALRVGRRSGRIVDAERF